MTQKITCTSGRSGLSLGSPCGWLLAVASLVCVADGAASELADAVQRGQGETVRRLLDSGTDVDAPQADGATALAWAVHRNEPDLVELLLRAGADPNLGNDLGVTPLMLAAVNGSVGVVEALLQAGGDPSLARESGDTVLMLAARSGSVEVVRQLLDHGALVNEATVRGATALMWAVAERHLAVTRLLLQRGAAVDARTTVDERDGRPGGIVRQLRVLSEFEAVNPANLPRDGDRDPPRPEGGFTPLLYAVLVGDGAAVGALLDAGADANERAPDGVTAVMLALTKRYEDLAVALLARGADPTPDEAGYAALHVASATGQRRAALALLAAGADPNARMARPQRLTNAFEIGVFQSPGSGRLTQIGSTPVLVAAKSSDAAMVQLLVDAGADAYATTDDGTTALMMAAGLGKRAAREITYYRWSESQAIETLAVLLELGLDVNTKNAHGETALHAAAYHNANDLIRYLVSQNADIDAANGARQTALRLAEGHLVCCTTFVRHEEAADVLRGLGADSEMGIQLTFGLTAFGDDAEPPPE